MNNLFAKIGVGSTIDAFDNQLKSSIHMTHYRWQKYGIALKKTREYQAAVANTYEVTPDIESEIISLIPKDLISIEKPRVWFLEVEGAMDAVSMLPPHVDNFRVCTINFYLKANGETTKYYDYKPNGTLEEIDSFCAKTNECWILNTTTPHSVELIPGKTRSVLGVSFLSTPFEKVISFFS